jgi:hypothetical protein
LPCHVIERWATLAVAGSRRRVVLLLPRSYHDAIWTECRRTAAILPKPQLVVFCVLLDVPIIAVAVVIIAILLLHFGLSFF